LANTTTLLNNPQFRADLVAGTLTGKGIADKWGCSATTAKKWRQRLRAETESPAAVDSDSPLTGKADVGVDGGEFIDVQTTEPVADWAHIFERFNLDPDAFEVVGETVRCATWQQSKRLENGDRDVQNLFSYRAQFRRRREAIDLPALYAEARKPHVAFAESGVEPITVVVAWADLQVGKVDRLGDTKALLERLDEKRIALAGHLATRRPERIIVADVGDIVEGFDNVQSQTRTNDLSLMEQVDVAATEFWKTIKLCAAFAPVDVLSIPSNHAQWRKGKDLIGKPTDDWGLHISQRLEFLAGEVGLGVEFHRPEDWAETLTFDVRGTILGLAHGHQAGTADRVCTWWEKMSHASVMDCDVLLQGHFHHLRVEPSGRSPRTGKSRWRLQAPTLDNGSTWIRNTAGADSDPGLLVFGVTDDGFDISTLAVL